MCPFFSNDYSQRLSNYQLKKQDLLAWNVNPWSEVKPYERLTLWLLISYNQLINKLQLKTLLYYAVICNAHTRAVH